MSSQVPRTNLRFCYLSHSSVPSPEANSLQVMKMCAALARHCEEVVLFCRAAGPDEVDAHEYYGVSGSFRVVRVRSRRIPVFSRVLYSLRVLARLRGVASDALLYGRDYHTLALLALLGISKRSIVLEVHQPPGNAVERFLLRSIFKSRHFRRLVVISKALAEEYRRSYGALVSGRITVAYDGADTLEPGREATNDDQGARGQGRLALGYVGNLYPGKGMELIEQLAERLPDCEFHVIGGKPTDVTYWRGRVCSENVMFHGFVTHDEAQRRMRGLDVLLAPYQRSVLIGGDGTDISRWMSPLKIFEYMASGKPMVASDLPVLREVLRDGWNALLADPMDVEAWVLRIRSLGEDENLRLEVGTRAQNDLAVNYTWDRRVELVLADLQSQPDAVPEAAGSRG